MVRTWYWKQREIHKVCNLQSPIYPRSAVCSLHFTPDHFTRSVVCNLPPVCSLQSVFYIDRNNGEVGFKERGEGTVNRKHKGNCIWMPLNFFSHTKLACNLHVTSSDTRAIAKFWGGFILSHEICRAVHDYPRQTVGLIFATEKVSSVDLRKFAHLAKLRRLNSVLTSLNLSKLC